MWVGGVGVGVGVDLLVVDLLGGMEGGVGV